MNVCTKEIMHLALQRNALLKLNNPIEQTESIDNNNITEPQPSTSWQDCDRTEQ